MAELIRDFAMVNPASSIAIRWTQFGSEWSPRRVLPCKDQLQALACVWRN